MQERVKYAVLAGALVEIFGSFLLLIVDLAQWGTGEFLLLLLFLVPIVAVLMAALAFLRLRPLVRMLRGIENALRFESR